MYYIKYVHEITKIGKIIMILLTIVIFTLDIVLSIIPSKYCKVRYGLKYMRMEFKQ